MRSERFDLETMLEIGFEMGDLNCADKYLGMKRENIGGSLDKMDMQRDLKRARKSNGSGTR